MDMVGTDPKRVLEIRYKLMAMYHLCSKCVITYMDPNFIE